MTYIKPSSTVQKPMNTVSLSRCKNKTKISMITCYDYPSACLIDKTSIDCILVGDSVAMTVHGYQDTTHATVEMMALHTAAVRRGTPKFIITDMPFMSYRKSLDHALDNVEKLVRAGANAIKLEGAHGNLELIQHIVHSGVPVVGHIGLTPQHVNQLGGYRIQGKTETAQEQLMREAEQLQQAGCFMLVLECVPNMLAAKISQELDILTIGIGAGAKTDGQVLVWHDLLGLYPNTSLKFLKQYANSHSLILNALLEYDKEVKAVSFPTAEHCY